MSSVQSLETLAPQTTPDTVIVAVDTVNVTTSKPKQVNSWMSLGALLLWFVIFTVLFWLIYYSLKPSFVLQNNSDQVDTAKVLLASVISALILVIIVWLIRLAIGKRY